MSAGAEGGAAAGVGDGLVVEEGHGGAAGEEEGLEERTGVHWVAPQRKMYKTAGGGEWLE